MAKTNFSYEKRQRELEKKKKAEEKARKKLEAKNGRPADAADAPESHDEQPDNTEGSAEEQPAA